MAWVLGLGDSECALPLVLGGHHWWSPSMPKRPSGWTHHDGCHGVEALVLLTLELWLVISYKLRILLRGTRWADPPTDWQPMRWGAKQQKKKNNLNSLLQRKGNLEFSFFRWENLMPLRRRNAWDCHQPSFSSQLSLKHPCWKVLGFIRFSFTPTWPNIYRKLEVFVKDGSNFSR